eukprot:TRINITY_DN4918_c0_g2_i1.p1 TRINITY_DN4918_c0_g2~~TRINITY_DN4918_c0_g2_i1.p1  ORF type:complete len:434 (+),score=60.52 TRINITY_DN4918_c0_g2_i1:61-1362(+)
MSTSPARQSQAALNQPHWLGNGQAIAALFVLVSTVCLYPSNMVSSYDDRHALVLSIGNHSTGTIAYKWTEDLGQLPDLVRVPASLRWAQFGMADFEPTVDTMANIQQLVQAGVESIGGPTSEPTCVLKVFLTGSGMEPGLETDGVLKQIGEMLETQFEFERVRVSRLKPSEKVLLSWLGLNQAKGHLKQLLTSTHQSKQPLVSLGAMDLDARAAAVAFSPLTGTTHELSTIHSVLLGGGRLAVVTHELMESGTDFVWNQIRSAAWSNREPCLAPGASRGSVTGIGSYDACRDALSTIVQRIKTQTPTQPPQIAAGMKFVATSLMPLAHSFLNLTATAPLAAMDRSARNLCSSWDLTQIKAAVLREASSWDGLTVSQITCFLPAYMSVLLPQIYGIGTDTDAVDFSLRAEDSMGWALGSCLFDAWGGMHPATEN